MGVRIKQSLRALSAPTARARNYLRLIRCNILHTATKVDTKREWFRWTQLTDGANLSRRVFTVLPGKDVGDLAFGRRAVAAPFVPVRGTRGSV
jgi:hypothetical protein